MMATNFPKLRNMSELDTRTSVDSKEPDSEVRVSNINNREEDTL